MTPRDTVKGGLAPLALSAGIATAERAPFGTDADTGCAAEVRAAMETMTRAGEGILQRFPHEGEAPHGMMPERFRTTATTDGHSGAGCDMRSTTDHAGFA